VFNPLVPAHLDRATWFYLDIGAAILGRRALNRRAPQRGGMYLMAVLVILIVKLLDPIVAILALASGAMSRTWWHVGLAGLGIGLLSELLLSLLRPTGMFRPGAFIIAAIAAAAWSALAFWIKGRWKRRNANAV